MRIPREHLPAVALAAISYVVRAHALFFSCPNSEREFNGARVALNDIFQASRLGARLYYFSRLSHLKRDSQAEYLEEVRRGPVDGAPPWESPYFLWWLQEQVEIQRGNIYRQIDYVAEADRHYRRAQQRFDRLSENRLRIEVAADAFQGPDLLFVTHSVIRLLSERSKVMFDRGMFLESILNQLRALAFLVRRSKDPDLGLLVDIESTLRFLDPVVRQWLLVKERITERFREDIQIGETSSIDERDASWQPITPRRFIETFKGIGERETILACELFARLGFTLFILRRIPVLAGDPTQLATPDDSEWLRPFFTSHTLFGVQESTQLGAYCLDMLDGARADPDDGIFPDSLERGFAHLLRQETHPWPSSSGALTEQGFYRSVLQLTTQNIDNLVTMPKRLRGFFMRRGYRDRMGQGALSKTTVHESMVAARERRRPDEKHKVGSKLVVLRRWQSVNPRIPRPHEANVRGGGCYLLWEGKGIVIDPGYDFIQNFYDEGFSLDDIDAVVVTHSHPDHDDDLSTLTTLLNECNEYRARMRSGVKNPAKIDLFLNESAHLKFSAWLKSSGVEIGRVVQLPLVVWDNSSQKAADEIRGRNVFIRLRDKYALDIEVVPAWHDDVIGRRAAVGLKFHLFFATRKKGRVPVGIVGYTGDTGAYLQNENRSVGRKSVGTVSHAKLEKIANQYRSCDVLVAHLGDIRLRELSGSMTKMPVWKCVNDLFLSRFVYHAAVSDQSLDTRREVEQFLEFLDCLNLVTEEELAVRLDGFGRPALSVREALTRYVWGKGRLPKPVRKFTEAAERLKAAFEPSVPSSSMRQFEAQLDNNLAWLMMAEEDEDINWSPFRIVCAILAGLCAAATERWKYEYHLGITGVYQLHKAMAKHAHVKPKVAHPNERVFVVAELPEELSSYRHHVARLLNRANPEVPLKAFTGDIGLHVGLVREYGAPQVKRRRRVFQPRVRCTYCTYNNETVLLKENYHSPSKVLETSLKRLDSAMIYLCTKHDHHPENEGMPHEFLSRPILRVV